MKKFAFDLENILELRKYREQETEIALGRAVGELNHIEQNIRNVAEEKVRASSERFSLGYGVSELLSFDRYVQRLDSTKERLLEDAAKAEVKVEAAREVYIEAERDREVLDKVKEDEAKDYRKQAALQAEKVLDDFANDMYTRKKH
jgi:flagellar FliJ protein